MAETKRTNPVLVIIGVLLGAGLFVMCLCGIGGVAVWRLGSRIVNTGISSGLEPQNEDYAEVRRRFATKLLRPGPSPQPGDPNYQPRGAQEVSYRSRDLTLKAFVAPPPVGAGKRPAVLFLHGGFAFGDGDFEMAQAYRDAGYVVMVPVLRGENGQPGNFTLFFDEIEDVLGAADALAGLPYVDASRLYVTGHSAGATLAMLAAMASNKFKAAASFSGNVDQIALIRMRPDLANVFDGSDLREFQIRSPAAYVGRFKCPARLYFGSAEGWQILPSKQTATLAQQHGLDVEAVMVRGDHFTLVPDAIRQSIEFFGKH